MSKLIIVFLGIGISVILVVVLLVGMSFAGESNRGPGDAVSNFWYWFAWFACLVPAAAAIYNVNVDNMPIWLLVLFWLMGVAGVAVGSFGYDYFFPRYTTVSDPSAINTYAKFKNANAEFAMEKPEIVKGLFKPIYDKSGKRSDEFEKSEDSAIALAKTMGSPISIKQKDGKGDRVFLIYPYEVESNINVFPTTETELARLISGKPVSRGLLRFLSALPSIN
jgi:hypothetical protein